MTGYTDAVVLEAPVFWWPPLGELTRYPTDPVRSFLAAVADAAMPWPCGAQSSAVHSASAVPTVGLSRLGRAVWLTAEWSPAEDGDEQPFVKVWSPINAETLYLPVSTSLGLGGSWATHDEVVQLDLRQLVREGRVRLTHRVLPESLRSPSPASLSRFFDRLQRRAQGHPAYPLLHRVLADVRTSTLTHLHRVVRTATTTAASSLAANAGSFLFTGDTPSQRQLLQLLRLSTPPLFPVSGAPVVVVALEARRLDFAEVLTLSEHEALETVEAVLQPPPLPTATAARLLPCLLITLEGLHLLEAQANAVVAGVTHQLCMCLEALHDGPVPALVWAFAEDTDAVSVALRSRVAAQHVRLATTTAEDRTVYLTQRLVAAQQGGSCSANTTTPPPPLLSAAVTALAEETAHWTVDQLVRVRDAELQKMCAAVPASTTNTSSSSSAQGVSPSLSTSVRTSQQPPASSIAAPHPVYRHLYGIDDDIRRVEELVVWPLTHLPLLRDLAIPCSKGVLLCGPSGSGKTALLSALVRRLQQPDTRGIHVQAVDGLALIEKEVGRSEKNIASLFDTARALAPTALFIDNLDALAPPRGRTTSETNTTGDRTLSTLLTQMDGVSDQTHRLVVVVASAPSVRTLDPAVCRPGRLDVHVHLRLPPTSSSADFMKRRLRLFVTQVYARFGTKVKEHEGEGAATTDFVDPLVDAYIAAVAAKVAAQDGADGDSANGAATMSPAEVSAVVREVMLHVTEQLSHRGSIGEKESTEEDVQRCVAGAFAMLGDAK